MTILETSRLTLRPLREADAPRLARYAGDLDVARMCGTVPSPYPVLAAEGWLMMHVTKRKSSPDMVCGIEIKGDTGLVGVVGLHGAGEPFLGYWVARPVWGRGVATEAAGALIHHYVSERSPEVITADYYLDNPASGRVLEKLGFVREGEPEKLFSLARPASAPGQHMVLRV